MTTIAMMRLSDTRPANRPAEMSGSASAGSARGDRAENADAAALEPEQHHRRARQPKTDQGAGNARIDPLRQRR